MLKKPSDSFIRIPLYYYTRFEMREGSSFYDDARQLSFPRKQNSMSRSLHYTYYYSLLSGAHLQGCAELSPFLTAVGRYT